MRLDCIKVRLRRLIRVLTLIRLEQVRAELCQCSKMYSLVRMLDLTCIQQVVENGSHTAQLPETASPSFMLDFLSSADTADAARAVAHGFPRAVP